MRVLQIDDHGLFRRGVQFLLADLDPDIEFVEAASCEDAQPFAGQSFTLILLDLKLPGRDRLESLAWAKHQFESSPVVVLSGEEDPQLIRAAIEQGAAGYVPKATTPEVMVDAIRLILAGGTYLPSYVVRNTPPPGGRPLTTMRLSERQREVLVRAVQGKPNKIIARELSVSEGTVKAHLSAAFRLLGVSNRVEAVYAAARQGIGSAPVTGGYR